jgi:hypothetical protein
VQWPHLSRWVTPAQHLSVFAWCLVAAMLVVQICCTVSGFRRAFRQESDPWQSRALVVAACTCLVHAAAGRYVALQHDSV